MLEQQAMMIQQSQEKQELDRIEKEKQIIKMDISNLIQFLLCIFKIES